MQSISYLATPLNDIEIKRIAQLDIEALFTALASSPLGLASKQARIRLRYFGPNQVRTQDQSLPLFKLGRMMSSPLPLLLMILALVSYITGEKAGALVIAAMVFISIFFNLHPRT